MSSRSNGTAVQEAAAALALPRTVAPVATTGVSVVVHVVACMPKASRERHRRGVTLTGSRSHPTGRGAHLAGGHLAGAGQPTLPAVCRPGTSRHDGSKGGRYHRSGGADDLERSPLDHAR